MSLLPPLAMRMLLLERAAILSRYSYSDYTRKCFPHISDQSRGIAV